MTKMKSYTNVKNTIPDYTVMYTGNGDIKVHIWILISLMLQQFAVQLQFLVCDTKDRAEILFGKDAFVQVGCWQDYTNKIVY